MTYELLRCEKRDKVAVVTLNRPEKRNTINTQLRDEISEALSELEADDAISVAVISGAGPVFCAGFDTKEFETTPPAEIFSGESSRRYHSKVQRFAKPLVAAVNGPAMGGGFDLAVLCDVRIAAESAAFAHPEIKFGAPTLFGPLAVRKIKETVLKALGRPPEEGHALEDEAVRVIMRSEDAREGPRAFAEKRRPRYVGR